MKKITLIFLAFVLLACPLAVGAQENAPVVELQHVLLSYEQDVLAVTEILSINNPAKTAYEGTTVNGKKVSLEIPLPKGAAGLQVQGFDNDKISPTANGIALTGPIPPGKTQIQMGYNMGKSNSYDLSRTMTYSVQSFNIMTQDEKIKVTSNIPLQAEKVAMGDAGNFTIYRLANLPAGQALELKASLGGGLSAAKIILYASIVLVAVAGLALLFLLLKRRRGGEGDEPGYEEMVALLKRAKRQYRMTEDKSASLDQEHQEGQISTEDYQEKSEALEKKLERLKKQIRELEVSLEEIEEDDDGEEEVIDEDETGAAVELDEKEFDEYAESLKEEYKE